ncbi:MAG: hypothetical protein JJ866_25085 [Roseibium sp.]|uniref:hypothetical protein n=1 Tax=Roseibium sp. TaxID=1936156 RepID=UPI001B210325|nr:hypothetical protein [Roseibium sp.]MBO6507574.1 hypothetical protein [Roseibium sp.]MBO6895233.1 hypothetical protein [Roseibium sp.]MBO6930743.1 hypothetical protein [Roseibium sp.]
MKNNDFTTEQLEFLDLWKIAADYDCLYLLDFYCYDMFDHNQTSDLTDEERADLARTARPDIFAEAIQKGYVPSSDMFGGADGQIRLC